VHAELRDEYGLSVNRKRVARLMREAGLQGLYRRRRGGCTVSDPCAQTFPDLVDRNFIAEAPNRRHPTEEGRLYCAAVMEVYSRLIVGWSIDDNMRKELVIDALGMAIIRRRPNNQPGSARTIAHSDHGSQYTSWAFGNDSEMPDCSARWARSATAMTTR
jgi:putative transposase